MKIYKSAFTLSELMIALGVIGILAAVLIPIVHNIMPDQNILLARRAYAMTQDAVKEIVGDEGCYPESESDVIEAKRNVLNDGRGFPSCSDWNDSDADDPGQKFATLFSTYLIGEDATEFRTAEGIKWKLYPGDYDADDLDKHYQIIQVDVDGGEPRCSKASGDDCTTDLDVFQMRVSDNGKIEVGQKWAKTALNLETSVIDSSSSTEGEDSEDYHTPITD